jgi:RimJ/RimL family protein N-acetyltransferase
MQGRGYATEVYIALIDWAAVHTTHTFVSHSVHSENIPSISLAQRFHGIIQSEVSSGGFSIYHIPIVTT